jgi:cobalt-zinc-cadmium efflux system membrane fusion protein
MMSTRLLIALCGWLACACGPGASPNPPAAGTDSPPPADRAASDDPSRITVDEEMLRDLRITLGAVESRTDGERLSLLGELAVDQRAYAEVGVPLPARVTRLAVHAGAQVRAGETLAELSSPELGRARADYLSAEARVRLADAALERTRALVDERILPVREQQEAESATASAQADLRAARATLGAFGVPAPTEERDAASSTFVLRSPISGAVIEQSTVLGQMLEPATPGFRIGNLSRLWLTVHAFERDAVRVREGASARLTFPALPGQEFQGTVALVGHSVEHESRTVPVRIDVSNADRVLRPGMTATAVVPVGLSGAPILSVPVAAVQRVGTEWCVFVPQDARTFEIRRIGRGRDLTGEVEILSGLRAGESIVVDGAFLLKSQAENRSSSEHDGH